MDSKRREGDRRASGGPARDERPTATGTAVDLGDDLLERTATGFGDGADDDGELLEEATRLGLQAPAPAASSARRAPAVADAEVQDRLQTARILMGEGFLEESKKGLRRLLIALPGNLAARRLLDEVHELELKQIFGQARAPKRRVQKRKRVKVKQGIAALLLTEDDALTEVDGQLALERLEADLGLGLGLGADGGGGPAATREFSRELSRLLLDVSGREELDVGIAYLQMGLHAVARERFESAAQKLEVEREAPPVGASRRESIERRVACHCHLAYCLIQERKPFEAIRALQPALNDPDTTDDLRREIFYWLGRAEESLGRRSEAKLWYDRAVGESRVAYRDAHERTRWMRERTALEAEEERLAKEARKQARAAKHRGGGRRV